MSALFALNDLHEAVADLLSLASPSSPTSIREVERLATVVRRVPDTGLALVTEICLEHNVYAWLLQSLEYSTDAEHKKKTLHAISALSRSRTACVTLLELGVAERLCYLFYLG